MNKIIIAADFASINCEWLDGYAGMSLAIEGRCLAGGMWWANCCPEFEDEEEFIRRAEVWLKISETV